MAENELRCNNLRCRTYVAQQGKAVVTTCSHIFCVPCANALFTQGSSCPACDQHLDQPNDIVETYLNPSNDYKASILAGLPPGLIMEITARALSFWTYQTSQEAAFQAVVLRNTQDRLAQKEQHFASVHGELQMANSKIANLGKELENASRRAQDMANQLKDNDNEMRRLRGNYDKIKTRALLGAAGQVVADSDGRQDSDMSNGMRFQSRGPAPGTPMGNQPPHPFVPTPQGSGSKSLAATNRFRSVEQPNFAAVRLAGSSRRGFRSVNGAGSGLNPGNRRSTSENAPSEVGREPGRATSRLAQRQANGPSDFGFAK